MSEGLVIVECTREFHLMEPPKGLGKRPYALGEHVHVTASTAAYMRTEKLGKKVGVVEADTPAPPPGEHPVPSATPTAAAAGSGT